MAISGFRVNDDRRYESRGNGDGVAQCGETIELYIDAHNNGTSTLTGLSARFVRTDPHITLLYNAGSRFHNVAPGRSKPSLRDWELAIDDDTPDGYEADLTFNFKADGGGEWQATMKLTITCG